MTDRDEQGETRETRSAARLEQEAEQLRRQMKARAKEKRTRYSGVRKAFYFAVMILALVGSVSLLIWSEWRRERVDELVGLWWNATPVEEQTFDLPPPPPRPVEPRIEVGGDIGLGGFEGVLYADGNTPGGGEEEAEEGEFVPPAMTSEGEQAFQLLLTEANLAQQLSSGELQGFEYQKWQPVKNDSPVFWIDLVATRLEDDSEQHFVWEVRLDDQSVRPLSQIARDLSR